MRPHLSIALAAALLVAPAAAQERGRASEPAQQQGQGRPAKPSGRGKAPERPAASGDGASSGLGAAPTPPTGRGGPAQGRGAESATKAPRSKTPPAAPKASESAAAVAVAPVPPPDQMTLASAQALFRSADGDGDGKLDLREAAKAGLGPRDCNAADADGDHLIAESEFFVAYAALLAKQQRKLAPDLQAAATAAAAATAPATAPKASPTAPSRSGGPVVAAPAPSRPGTAQYELENKIEEALRKNLGDQYVPRPTPPPAVEVVATLAPAPSASAAEQPAPPSEDVAAERSIEQRAAELREALEARLRDSGAGLEEARIARARLERQLAELAQGAAKKPAPGSRRDPTRSPDERDRELRANLEAKLLEDAATPDQAANARARLEARIADMRSKDAERAAAAAESEPDAARSFEQRAEELRANLELKLAETNAPPAEAEAARARLERQLTELAQGSAPKPPPGSRRDPTRAPDERDRELREGLEAKLKADKASPEQAANARARLEQRIAEMRAKDAERGAVTAAAPVATPAAPPPAVAKASAPEVSAPAAPEAPAGLAPSEDPLEARFRNLREGLERKLAESGASPEDAAAERARLEKRIEALRREAAGGARGEKAGKKKRDGGG
jgi:hypothetical protein